MGLRNPPTCQRTPETYHALYTGPTEGFFQQAALSIKLDDSSRVLALACGANLLI